MLHLDSDTDEHVLLQASFRMPGRKVDAQVDDNQCAAQGIGCGPQTIQATEIESLLQMPKVKRRRATSQEAIYAKVEQHLEVSNGLNGSDGAVQPSPLSGGQERAGVEMNEEATKVKRRRATSQEAIYAKGEQHLTVSDGSPGSAGAVQPGALSGSQLQARANMNGESAKVKRRRATSQEAIYAALEQHHDASSAVKLEEAAEESTSSVESSQEHTSQGHRFAALNQEMATKKKRRKTTAQEAIYSTLEQQEVSVARWGPAAKEPVSL